MGSKNQRSFWRSPARWAPPKSHSTAHVGALRKAEFSHIQEQAGGRGHGLELLQADPGNIDILTSLPKRSGKSISFSYARILPKCHGHDLTPSVGSLTIDMHAHLTCITNAQSAFDRIQNPNPPSWKILIKAHVHNGRLDDAIRVLHRMPIPDVVSWTVIITALSHGGKTKEALDLFYKMQLQGFKPNRVTLISALDACTRILASEEGLEVHAAVINDGYEQDVKVGSSLINFYGKCGSMSNASRVFRTLIFPDVVIWNTLIGALTNNGRAAEGLNTFHQMQLEGFLPNKITFICTLDACASLGILEVALQVHVAISAAGYEQEVTMGNTLINMYGKCKSLCNARTVSGKMARCDIVSWNAMIGALAQNGHDKEALEMFFHMQSKNTKPDKVTYVSALDACTSMASLQEGRVVHNGILDAGLEQDAAIGVALIKMYGSCESLCDVRRICHRTMKRDVIFWTTLMAAFVQNRKCKEALDIFQDMQLGGIKPDKITFICALDACASMAGLEDGRGLHAGIVMRGYEQDVEVGTNLVIMYSKCGHSLDARNVFGTMLHRDALSWSSTIAAFAKNGQGKEALALYHQMWFEGHNPDDIIFACILDACADLATFEEGQKIHSSIIEAGYEKDAVVNNALITLYGKCGSLDDARRMFSGMCHQDVVLWTTMIAALSQNGHDNEALDLFYQMQVEGIKPDAISLVCALTACSHTGRIDDGKNFFVTIPRYYAIERTGDHLICMIDLLGRAGHLDEAEHLIESMPTEKAVMAWMCLLGACRLHHDVKRAMHASDYCFQLDPNNAAPYVTLSNLLTFTGIWEEAPNRVKQELATLKTSPLSGVQNEGIKCAQKTWAPPSVVEDKHCLSAPL